MQMLQDDLGYHDIGFHNDEMLPVSGNITALARGGTALLFCFLFKFCYPYCLYIAEPYPDPPSHSRTDSGLLSGVILSNQLVHFHCSPTRRSFLSGRLPIHHGEYVTAM